MENDEQQKEQQRVDLVVSKIDNKISTTEREYDSAHSETKKVQQNYADNTSVNYFEVDDRIETSAELQQQRGLVSRLTENESILKKPIRHTERFKKNHLTLAELTSKTMASPILSNFTLELHRSKTLTGNFWYTTGAHLFQAFTITAP
nr:hypothetical protein [Lentilactobacillus kisonensis]